MVYIQIWISIFAGAVIADRKRRYPNALAGACGGGISRRLDRQRR